MQGARGREWTRGKFILIAILAVIVVVALFQVVLALVVAK
jgi:Tfp pilus assembly protein PilX